MGLLDGIATFLRRRTFGVYKGESCDDLIALGRAKGAKRAIVALEAALFQKWSENSTMSNVEFDVLAVRALAREVNNGGFRQFFFNNSRAFTPIILLALRNIGCTKSLEAAEHAIAIMGTTDEEKLRELTDYSTVGKDDERLKQLGECDDAYYTSGEDVMGRLFEYVVENRESIDLTDVASGSGFAKDASIRALLK